MKHRVVLTPEARQTLHENAIWWAEHRSADQAERWLDGFERELASLATRADSCLLAPENAAFPFELRQLTFGLGKMPTHRAVFEIRDRTVIVHGIRHLAQRELSPRDL